MISLMRLRVGGAAMLAADSTNHQNVIAGKKARSPLVRNSLRVWVVSYVMLARANSADEQRP